MDQTLNNSNHVNSSEWLKHPLIEMSIVGSTFLMLPNMCALVGVPFLVLFIIFHYLLLVQTREDFCVSPWEE